MVTCGKNPLVHSAKTLAQQILYDHPLIRVVEHFSGADNEYLPSLRLAASAWTPLSGYCNCLIIFPKIGSAACAAGTLASILNALLTCWKNVLGHVGKCSCLKISRNNS